MKRIKSKNIILPDRILSGYAYFDDEGRITEVSNTSHECEYEYDFGELYVSPGFVDLHTHGAAGSSYNGSVEDIITAANFQLTKGATSICPTFSANEFSAMAASTDRLREAMKDDRLRTNIIGAHLEGPYLSRSQAGAQAPWFITQPNAEEYLPFIEKNRDIVARWSYAPEEDRNLLFTKALKESGIVGSAGHTNAMGEDMEAAYKEGLNSVTHLYSCTSFVTRVGGFRHLGVVESAYLNDDVYVEVIADGRHLPPELLKLIYKIKGKDRMIAITDSLDVAGTEEKSGTSLGIDYIIEDGVAKLPDRSAFAGSVATTDRLLYVLTHECSFPIVDAVAMMTKTPCTHMGLSRKGELKSGYDADIVVFDSEINVKAVFVGGRREV